MNEIANIFCSNYGQDEEIRHDLKNNMGKIRKVLKGI